MSKVSPTLQPEEAAELFFNSNPIPMWIYDVESLIFLDVNKAAEVNYGYSRNEFLKLSLKDVRPEEEVEKLINIVSNSGQDLRWPGILKHKKKDGSIIYVEIISSPINFKGKNARLVAANNVTERIKADEKIKQLLESEHKTKSELEENQKKLEFLIEAGELLNSSLDYNKTLKQLAELVTPKIADWCAVEILKGKKLHRLAVSHKDPQKVNLAFEIAKKYPADRNTEEGVYKVIKTLIPEFYPEIPEGFLKKSAKNKEHFRLMKSLGLHSAVIVPLVAHNRALGVLILVNSESSKNFDESDLLFTKELAKRAAIAIENAGLFNDKSVAAGLLETQIKERTKRLNETLVDLRNKEKNLRLIFESIKDYGIINIDIDGNVSSWNEGAERLLLYGKEEIIGRHFSIFFTETEKENKVPVRELNNALVNSKNESEGWRVKKDGTKFWTNSTIYSLKDNNNNLLGFVKIMKDMTEKKEYEDILKAQSQNLMELNKELESFSYSVSHDLRAPLRHIDGFVKLLQLDTDNKFSMESETYFNYILDSVSKMGNLIDNLLNFSRMGRTELNKSEIDLNNLVSETLIEFEAETANRKIEWEIKKLPVIFGDKFMIRQVFINLISNALKFTGKKEEAKIRIGSKENEKDITIFVKDNGAGFDIEYADKLFGVFQRLHSNSEFEGTGIGLANVKRIINRHGGRVWAEGEKNKGASIYFTFNKKDLIYE